MVHILQTIKEKKKESEMPDPVCALILVEEMIYQLNMFIS